MENPQHHSENSPQLPKGTLAALPKEKGRILDRMVEIGWATGWARNSRTGKVAVNLSPLGRRRLGQWIVITSAIGMRGQHSWIALDTIAHGDFVL